MLKLIYGLFLALVVLVESAYVSPTYAASANVVISMIQAGSVGAATQEYVELYNNSTEQVEITNWCVMNKSGVKFACFSPLHQNMKIFIGAKSYATIASNTFSEANGYHDFSANYAPTNQSSGSITASSDTISLVTVDGGVIDSHHWTTSLPAGSFLGRQFDAYQMDYIDTDSVADWSFVVMLSLPINGTTQSEELNDGIDVCGELDGYQPEIPESYFLNGDGQCELSSITITELLPNINGSDVGIEFIEIYNPNSWPISLGHYLLQVGPSFDQQYKLPANLVINPQTYAVVWSAEIGFSLLNTSSRVQIVDQSGRSIAETPSYDDPDEDMAWALIDGEWRYTNVLTPGAANVDSIPIAPAFAKTAVAVPCKDNQYRSEETSRCRLIEAAKTARVACRDDQYRSEETNRCRNIAVASTQSACKEGQERNPETNRCRNIVSVSKADYGVLGAKTTSRPDNWYIWAAIGGLILAALVYAGWEWRYELKNGLRQLRRLVRNQK